MEQRRNTKGRSSWNNEGIERGRSSWNNGVIQREGVHGKWLYFWLKKGYIFGRKWFYL